MSNRTSARVGIFGGTFDPVHVGHLRVARTMRGALGLDRVIWVPAGRPPHKVGQIVSDDDDRLAMLGLALAGSNADEISRVEMDRPGPSYTAETLAAMRQMLGDARLFFIMGEDSLRDLPTWREPARILDLAEIAVAGRPGIAVDLASLLHVLPTAEGRVHLVPIAETAVSSSEIRRRVAEGRSIRGLVPDPVAGYIAARRLYLPSSGQAAD